MSPIILDLGHRYKGFINSYLYSVTGEDSIVQSIYIELKDKNDSLLKHKRFINCTQTKSGYLYQFDIDKYKADVELFVQGKYSKFSQELKGLLCWKQPTNQIESSDMYKILYRTEEKRLQIEELVGEKLDPDAELCSVVDVAKEIFYE